MLLVTFKKVIMLHLQTNIQCSMCNVYIYIIKFKVLFERYVRKGIRTFRG